MEEELGQRDSTVLATSETTAEVVAALLFDSDLMPTWRISTRTPGLCPSHLISSRFISAF